MLVIYQPTHVLHQLAQNHHQHQRGEADHLLLGAIQFHQEEWAAPLEEEWQPLQQLQPQHKMQQLHHHPLLNLVLSALKFGLDPKFLHLHPMLGLSLKVHYLGPVFRPNLQHHLGPQL
ncbi:hypothetical protein Ahy_B04g070689 isoform G [Arachis hypogaea]|uniref:Uncharacterized protein n=1 Tax=Arachis hypogaea TaxID=3818 RepID=A0A444ZIE6_ARAHY|nr:hypothetical protein Ahy_B04g070689 isoform G [Arachis hypogaea]